MSDLAIRVEKLGKQYRIGAGQSGYRTFREALIDGLSAPVRRLRGLSPDGQDQTIWALRDVSFDMKHGEVLGIIGRNGAGKSTILKILSQITEPTEGHAEVQGRVGSLLEVGTGFHPELTGRENIYLNGAILGMKKAEINRKFDEIVAFAEVEKFIDTPVKHYSTGMYLRLAFAVAAHLEPDILLVDEVLAVGDHEFQKKCLGRMQEIGKEGRTVLFVSHNLAAVEKICPRTVLLWSGAIVEDGPSNMIIKRYLKSTDDAVLRRNAAYWVNTQLLDAHKNTECSIREITLLTLKGEPLLSIGTGEPLVVRMSYKARRKFVAPAFVVSFKSSLGTEVLRLSTMPISGYEIHTLYEEGQVNLTIPSLPLTAGRCYLDVGLVRANVEWIERLVDVVAMDVEARDVYRSGDAMDQSRSLIVVPHSWDHRPCRIGEPS